MATTKAAAAVTRVTCDHYDAQHDIALCVAVDIADNTGSTEDSLMTTGGSDSTKPVSEARSAYLLEH